MALPEMTRELWGQCVEAGCESNGATLSPDQIHGVEIANGDMRWPPLPADLHDCRYFMGGAEGDRIEADDEFLGGLYGCVDAAELEGFREEAARRRCRVYHEAVCTLGDRFWNYKATPTVG